MSILPQDPNILQLNKERDLFFGTLDKYPLLAGGGGKSQAVQAGAGPQPPSASPACASPSSVTPQHTGDHKPALCNNLLNQVPILDIYFCTIKKKILMSCCMLYNRTHQPAWLRSFIPACPSSDSVCLHLVLVLCIFLHMVRSSCSW